MDTMFKFILQQWPSSLYIAPTDLHNKTSWTSAWRGSQPTNANVAIYQWRGKCNKGNIVQSTFRGWMIMAKK